MNAGTRTGTKTHLGIRLASGPAAEAKAAAAETATAVVEAAATGPILVTAGETIGIVWRDADGWQSQIYSLKQTPAMRIRTTFGGYATVEQALVATAANVARGAWSHQEEDDQAFFESVMGCLCQPPSLTKPAVTDLVRWAKWQRRCIVAQAAGHAVGPAGNLAGDAELRQWDNARFLREVWTPATRDGQFLAAIGPILDPTGTTNGKLAAEVCGWIASKRE